MSDHLHPGPHLDADQISAFMEGVLPEHERMQGLAHMAECARCREIVFLAQGPLPLPVPSPAEETPSFWQRWLRPLPLAGAAVFASAVLVVVTLHFHASPTPAPDQVATVKAPAPPAPEPTSGQAPLPQQETVSRPPEALTKPIAAPQTKPLPAAPNVPPPVIAGAVASVSPAPVPVPSPLAQRQTAIVNNRSVDASAVQGTFAARAVPPTSSVASGSALAPPSAPALDQGQIQQLPIDGRSMAPLRQYAAKSASNVAAPFGGPLHLVVEPGRGPADGLARVQGTITDPSGALVPGAIVTLHHVSGNAPAQAKADAFGHFMVDGVPAGRYQVQVASPGFTTLTQQVDLGPRDLALLNPVLPIGVATQTVEVTAAAPMLMTENAALAAVTAPPPQPLPSKLAITLTATTGGRTLALDSAGTLFLGSGGKHWRQVKPQWSGRVTQLSVITPASQTDAAQAGAAIISIPEFQLTTDTGAIWRSADGKHWHLR